MLKNYKYLVLATDLVLINVLQKKNMHDKNTIFIS